MSNTLIMVINTTILVGKLKGSGHRDKRRPVLKEGKRLWTGLSLQPAMDFDSFG